MSKRQVPDHELFTPARDEECAVEPNLTETIVPTPGASQVIDSPLEMSRHALRGSLWTYLAFASGKALSFATTVILARLLLPEELGLVGYSLIALQYLGLLNLFGMDAALISRRDRVQEAANAALLLNIGTGALLFGAAWVGAPWVAKFFHAEPVTHLLRLLALSLPMSALGAVPDALVQRELRFKARLLPEFARSLLKGAISVALAWRGMGALSLVIGHIAGEGSATVLVWILARWRPTFVFDARVAREVTRFGAHIVAIGILGALFGNIDFLFVGRVLGAGALGYYTLAYRIPELLLANTNVVVARVAYPLFCRLRSDAQQLRATYFNYVRYMSLLIFPAGVGLAVTAAPFVLLFYSSRWTPSILSMQLISIALALSSIGFVPGVLYKAYNRPEILTRLAVVKTIPAIPIFWYGTRWGIAGVACGQIVTMIINVALDVAVVSRVLHFKVSENLRALAPAAFASVVMGLAGLPLARILAPAGVLGLATLVLCGITVYGLTLIFVSRESIVQARKVLLPSR